MTTVTENPQAISLVIETFFGIETFVVRKGTDKYGPMVLYGIPLAEYARDAQAVNVLDEYFSAGGTKPQEVHTDCAYYFTSGMVGKYLSGLGIKHCMPNPLRPHCK